MEKIKSLPQKIHLETLDGQKVELKEFYNENGIFMGSGHYCSILYSGYK